MENTDIHIYNVRSDEVIKEVAILYLDNFINDIYNDLNLFSF